MTAPRYTGAAGQTLVYVADSTDPTLASIAAMDAGPTGSAPRLVTHPGGASPAGGTLTATQDVVTGKDGLGKAASMLYPAGDATKAQDVIFCNPAVPPGLGVTNFYQFAAKFTSDGDGSETFPIKFVRVVTQGHPGGGAPQWGTHDHLPWLLPPGGTQNPGTTYWEFVCGGDDPDKDQGIQPLGPYWKSSVNGVANDGYWNYVIEYRPHSGALEADGVTKATVSITGDGTHNTGLTAVFSSSMAGKLANGQTISLQPFLNAGGNYVYGPFTVSAFDGDRTCTLSALLSSTYAPKNGVSAGIHYALAFDGCARQYVNGTKIMDVSAAAVGVTPPGGEKPWCSAAILACIPVDDPPHASYPLWIGGDHSSLTPTKNVTMLVNFGDADATNVDTLTIWTETYSATAGAADHLAVTQEPSASTQSGQPHAQQPAGVVQDASNATVSSDTSTVTASWVSETGTGTAGGTLTVVAVAGVWAFTNLSVTSAAGCTGHWHFADGSLTGVDSATITILAGVVGTPTTSALPGIVDQWRPQATREGLKVIVSPSPLIGTGGLVAVASNTVSVHIPVGRLRVSVLSLAFDAMVAAVSSGAITVQVFKVTSAGVATALTTATSIASDVITVAGNLALPILASAYANSSSARIINGALGDFLRVDIVAAGSITTQPQLRVVAELAVTG